MKRWLMMTCTAALSVAAGCGGNENGTQNGPDETQGMEVLRPYAEEALINSTLQTVEWTGGEPTANVDIVFVPEVGSATILSGNLPNSGETTVRIDLLSDEQRIGGTVAAVPTGTVVDGTPVESSVKLGKTTHVGVGSLAAFSWNGTEEEYSWLNVHNGKTIKVGTVGDMQSWTFNTLAADHDTNRLHIVAFNAANEQKVYTLHSKTGALVSDVVISGASVSFAGLLLTQAKMLVAFAWDGQAMAEKMYSIDPTTGVAAEVGTVGDLLYWQTETAYSPTADEVYVAGINATDEHKLYVMNGSTGQFVRSMPLVQNGSPIQNVLGFSMTGTGDLIAFRWDGAAEQMLRIDTMTGEATAIGTVGDLQWWSTVADVNVTNNRAYVIGSNGAMQDKLYTLDTESGALVDEIVINDYPTNAMLVY